MKVIIMSGDDDCDDNGNEDCDIHDCNNGDRGDECDGYDAWINEYCKNNEDCGDSDHENNDRL